MNNCVIVLGESGSGKSTSLRNLNPEETFVLNVLDKPLPFRGYKKKYNDNAKNYYSTDNYLAIIKYINAINERRPEIKSIIIDDFNFIMSNEFMHRSSERGYDRFTDIGKHTFDIVETIKGCREDLYCFILSHTEITSDGKIKCKTVGKVIDDKVSIEGRVTTVLHALIIDGEFKF